MPGYVGPESPTNMIILEETKNVTYIIVLSIYYENNVFLIVLCRFIFDDLMICVIFQYV